MICNLHPGNLIYNAGGIWRYPGIGWSKSNFPTCPRPAFLLQKLISDFLVAVWGNRNEATASQPSVNKHGHTANFVSLIVIDYKTQGPSQSLEFGCGSVADPKFLGELLF
jgi:hypothetical protein